MCKKGWHNFDAWQETLSFKSVQFIRNFKHFTLRTQIFLNQETKGNLFLSATDLGTKHGSQALTLTRLAAEEFQIHLEKRKELLTSCKLYYFTLGTNKQFLASCRSFVFFRNFKKLNCQIGSTIKWSIQHFPQKHKLIAKQKLLKNVNKPAQICFFGQI